MNRHLRNAAAFFVGILISFLLMVPSAFAATNLIAGKNATGVTNGVFRSGVGNSSAYVVGSSAATSYGSTATDVTVGRSTPFSAYTTLGKMFGGAILDSISIPKANLKSLLMGTMKGGLLGFGLDLLSQSAQQKGFEWMEAAKQYYKAPSYDSPSGFPAIPGNEWDIVRMYCGTDAVEGNGKWMYAGNWGLRNGNMAFYCYEKHTAWYPYWTNTKIVYPGTPSCPSGYTMQNNSCQPPKLPATDSDVATFIDDVLANYPDRAIKDLIAAGVAVDYPESPSKQLVGPVISLPEEIAKTTTLNPDGTTTERKKTRTSEIQLAPTGELTRLDKDVETTTNKDVAGNPVSTSTSNTETKAESYPDVSDSTMPVVPALYTQKYAGGLKGVWDAKKAALQNTAFVQSISSLAPSNWNAGTCPSWNINFDLGANANYGNQEFPFPCWLVPFLKAALLLTAAFTARKLIWG